MLLEQRTRIHRRCADYLRNRLAKPETGGNSMMMFSAMLTHQTEAGASVEEDGESQVKTAIRRGSTDVSESQRSSDEDTHAARSEAINEFKSVCTRIQWEKSGNELQLMTRARRDTPELSATISQARFRSRSQLPLFEEDGDGE